MTKTVTQVHVFDSCYECPHCEVREMGYAFPMLFCSEVYINKPLSKKAIAAYKKMYKKYKIEMFKDLKSTRDNRCIGPEGEPITKKIPKWCPL